MRGSEAFEDPERIWRLRTQNLAWREIAGEVVALDLKRSEYMTPNAAGIELWRLLVGGATIHQLTQRLCERFAVGPENGAADARAFLTELADRQLLERGEPAG